MQIDLFDYLQENSCQEIHFFRDQKTGLKAIVAIHDLTLGPSLGGCRLREYPSTNEAIIDAVRLARGMTQKAAVSNLALGGGKTVLIKPKNGIADRKAYFRAFGRFVESLNGRYITAVDAGTSVSDMDLIEQETTHVTSTTSGRFSLHDPSPMTALGVFVGIKACVKHVFGSDNLTGKHVLVQGLGHVGLPLCELLHQAGAKLTVFDLNKQAMQDCYQKTGANLAKSLDDLLKTPADIFAPCAMGAIVNNKNIDLLEVKIIAGGANNQLETPEHGDLLSKLGVLYAPDFVINAGGLIHVAKQHFGATEQESKQYVEEIYSHLTNIFIRAKQENKSPEEIAELIAQERINEKRRQL